jgi:hypothetical protein
MSVCIKHLSYCLMFAGASFLYGCGSEQENQGPEHSELTPSEVTPAPVGELSVEAGNVVAALEGTEVILQAEVTLPSDSSLKKIEWIQSASDEVRAELPADFAQRTIRFIAPQVTQTTLLNFTVRAESNRGQVVTDQLTVQVDNKPDTAQPANSKPLLKSAQYNPNPARPSEEISLIAMASDAEGDSIRFQWVQTAGSPVQIRGATNSQAQFTAPAKNDSLKFRVTVSPTGTGEKEPSAEDHFMDLTVDVLAAPQFSPLTPQECLMTPSREGCFNALKHFIPANPVTPGVGLASSPDSAGACTPGGELSWPHFWGALHEHTAYSDGAANTKPSDVFARVKSKGLDFAISTDHSDNMGLPVPVTAADDPQFCVTSPLSCVLSDPQNPASNLMKWDSTLEQAQKMSSNGFTAMRGYEWTSDRFGHANILFSRNYINPKTGPGYAITMDSLWAWFLAPSNFGGGNDGLLVFNHPGREDALHGPMTEIKSAIPINSLASPLASGLSELGLGGHAAHSLLSSEGDPAYAFNDFAYVPAADYRVVGLEVFGKGDEYDSDGKKGSWLGYALDKGWYLAPAGSEDHHDRSWGEANLPKTVLIARSRKPEDLREAFAARRMYAVAQNFNDLQLVLTAKDSKREYHMGARIASPDSSLQFNFRVEARPGKTAPYDLSKTVIEVISSQGQNTTKYIPVLTAAGQQSNFKLPVKDRQSWMFVRVRDSVSKKIVAVSAPFWFKPGSAPLPTCNSSR